NVVVFDKTGTLTEGRFGVVNRIVAEGWPEDKAMALTLAIEGDSEHPIARGIRQKAEEEGVQAEAISAFEAIKGRGIQAQWHGQAVYVEGPRLLEMLKLDLTGAMNNFRQAANDNAQTVVYLVVEHEVVA